MSAVYLTEASRLSSAWGERVRANREQAERLREWSDDGDHYAPLASAFRADPGRRDDATLNALLELARAEDVWLDIGAGAGRFSLALAGRVREVVAVEPSAGMRAEFESVRLEYGIENARVVDQRWPTDDPPGADVALISHVGYDIERMGAFLDSMERAASRECVAVLYDRAPGGLFGELWPSVHGEAEASLPGLGELIALLEARGTSPRVSRSSGRSWSFGSVEEAEGMARRRLWIGEGSVKAPLLREALRGRLVQAGDGSWSLGSELTQGIVRWTPPVR